MLLVCAREGPYVRACVYTLSVCQLDSVGWTWADHLAGVLIPPAGETEHRLKPKLKSSDWQQSKKGERPLEIWHGEPARPTPHTHTRPGFSLDASSCAAWEKDSCGCRVGGVKFKTASLLNILNVPSLCVMCQADGAPLGTARLGWEDIFRMLMERKWKEGLIRMSNYSLFLHRGALIKIIPGINI